MPDKYLNGFISKQGMGNSSNSPFEWRDNGKDHFSVKLKLCSTVFNQDPHICSLFQSFPSDVALKTESKYVLDQVMKAVENIRAANPLSLIHFMIPIMNFLLSILTNGCTVGQLHAFYGIVFMVESIGGYLNETNNERFPLIMTYIQNKMAIDSKGKGCLYVNIMQNLYSVLQVFIIFLFYFN